MHNISFIVIGKNEANNIKKCIESIKNICKEYYYEIIYIDSSSTDNTIDVLKEINDDNIFKYQIKSNRYSAALAREVGLQKASGDFIFFIDADMEIKECTDISYCLELFNDKMIGIVSGDLDEVWIKNNKIINKIYKIYNVNSNKEKLMSPGGYFITRKQFYEDVGGFNISLKCNEEVELFSRYKKANKKLIRTNKLLCLHRNEKDSNNKSHFSRFKSQYYVDFWRVIIKSIIGGYFGEYLSFNSQKKMLRSIFLTIFMILFVIFSFKFKIFISIPILYYGILIFKYRKNLRLMIFNQLNNIFVFFSIIYLFKKIKVNYSILDLRKGD